MMISWLQSYMRASSMKSWAWVNRSKYTSDSKAKLTSLSGYELPDLTSESHEKLILLGHNPIEQEYHPLHVLPKLDKSCEFELIAWTTRRQSLSTTTLSSCKAWTNSNPALIANNSTCWAEATWWIL